jgi:hypothetical protein
MAGFVADPGKDFKTGDTPAIARRLDTLAKKLGITIYGISGYRTPSQSAALPLGSANDPHTRGQAIDIGVNAQTRDSAASLTDAQLASVGLYRPFKGANEINHVQLIPQSSAKGIMQSIVDAAGHAGATIAGGIAGPAAKPAGDLATNVAGGAAAKVDQAAVDEAGKIAGHLVDDVWQSAAPKASYAGLFVLMIAAGAWLAVQGLSKSTKEPA